MLEELKHDLENAAEVSLIVLEAAGWVLLRVSTVAVGVALGMAAGSALTSALGVT